MTDDRPIMPGASAQAAALDWLIRQRDPAFDHWEEFGDWLGADEAHSVAYHELAALDADLGGLPALAVEAPTEAENVVPLAPRRVSRRAWLSGAVAASLVAVVGFSVFRAPSDDYRIETAMGEPQVVTLDDGSEIAVNGGSSVLLSRSDPRKAVLEHGQMLLTVVHSDTAPFRVSAGSAELVDVGTIFDVTHSDGRVVVAVSEGAVIYNPRSSKVRVNAGHRLVAREDGAVNVAQVSAASVGGWRGGQLVYDGVPLSEVVAEVTRTTGVELKTAPGAGSVLFRGALSTDMKKDGAQDALVRDLAALSGTQAAYDAGGWTLSR